MANIYTGQKNVTTSGTPVQLPDQSIDPNQLVLVKAKSGNSGTITVGNNATVAANGSSSHFKIFPGQSVPIACSNTSQIWIDSTVSGDGVEYIVGALASLSGGGGLDLYGNSKVSGGIALEVNQSVTSATTIFTQDVSNFRWVSIQLLAPVAWSGVTVQWECSNDNTNWVGADLSNLGSQSNVVGNSTGITGIYEGPVNFKYFRVRVSAYTSGTVQAIAEFFTTPSFLHTFGVQAQQIGNYTVLPTPTTSGGLTLYRLLSAATTNGNNIKSSAGQVYAWKFHNLSASVKFVKLYNKATTPTVGTDIPVKTIPIQPNSSDTFSTEVGIAFSAGIGIGITGAVADSDTTAVAANDVVVNLDYK